ncbi:leucyl aminopeptidase [Nocardioides jishulii]|uniref:Probable cytosol aminopeptidase n=2 Tax=Nocardioides jishulii TaxID=2575440 RepID=A0A4U2YL09_9ACTN|nr:leucyl aminopeptidase [Nocardioides jishulii]TKI61828.1 leucyl aminopeptidase [Nocardioides jishulii]
MPSLPAQVSPPEFAISANLPHEINGVEVLALPVLPAPDEDSSVVLGPGAEEAAEALGIDLLAVLETTGATGRTGEVTRVPVVEGELALVLLVGVGQQTATDFRRAGAALARAVKDRASVASSISAIAEDDGFEAFVVGTMLGSFGFHWRSAGPKERPVRQVVLAGVADADALRPALATALAIGGAGWRARMLATVPSNVKNPAWLADQAVEVAGLSGLEVKVWDEDDLAEQGFGGLLAVGRASTTPPRLVQLEYSPVSDSPEELPRLVLVGKGITFDTGGLSIKPAEGMVNMKRDMTGAAVVLATMAALSDVGCPVRVTGLLAIAENAVGGDAMRPGDVIRHFGGRTSEVNNTDAEGRLVLADAMAYAVAELAPDVLVDVATLTGAMKVALGVQTGGFFANDQALADKVSAAGDAAGEPVWRMPLVADYEEKIASKVADGDNAAGGAGAITAALFLQHFAGDVPWAHLDIASVGDSASDRHEWTAGPTGFGARLLLQWLRSEAPLDDIARDRAARDRAAR